MENTHQQLHHEFFNMLIIKPIGYVLTSVNLSSPIDRFKNEGCQSRNLKLVLCNIYVT